MAYDPLKKHWTRRDKRVTSMDIKTDGNVPEKFLREGDVWILMAEI